MAIPGLAVAFAALAEHYAGRFWRFDIPIFGPLAQQLLRPFGEVERHFWPRWTFYTPYMTTHGNGPPP